jgi:spermidine/putrescine transport system ATP-binding protein
VENVVYIGTDTHYEVRLPGDERIRVREQNDRPDSRPLAHEGDEVTVSFSAEAARVLTE